MKSLKALAGSVCTVALPVVAGIAQAASCREREKRAGDTATCPNHKK